MRSASGHNDLLDLSPAHQAWFALTAVNTVLELEETFFAIGIDVIGNRRASGGDRFFEHFAQRPMELFELGAGQRIGAAARAYSGAKKAFIGVDVCHPVKQRLIEQQGLDWSRTRVNQPDKIFDTDLKRLRARPAEAALAHLQPAEAARIDEP